MEKPKKGKTSTVEVEMVKLKFPKVNVMAFSFLGNAIYGLRRGFRRRVIEKNIERADEMGFRKPNKVEKRQFKNKNWTF